MFSIIAATASNNVIGRENQLLWHLPEDLKRFKLLTLNHKILMGKNTFYSLPGILPDREHFVASHDKNLLFKSEKVKTVNNLNEFIEKNKDSKEEIFVIGGGIIYKELLPYTQKLYITEIHKDFEGDTFFPEINYKNYTQTYKSEIFTDEASGISYSFSDYILK